ncbi:MAG: hypothetical protein HeimC3_11570 [Candidatus Heimdallarchaeota archaeon LC_3]|nr:MAG: hypothetical protein HeimC3_11570 [Candidatus Heimdallarchaeota archaeon LC_3]
MASQKRKIEQQKKMYARNRKFAYITGILFIVLLIIGSTIFLIAPPVEKATYFDEVKMQEVIYDKFSIERTIGQLIFGVAIIDFLIFISFFISMKMVKPVSGKIFCDYCGASYDPDTPLTRCLDCMRPFKL